MKTKILWRQQFLKLKLSLVLLLLLTALHTCKCVGVVTKPLADEGHMRGSENTGKTPSCAADYWPRQLAQMESYVDDTVLPCDDFYSYACGNWRVPYTLRARDTLTAVKADNKRQLMTYLAAVAATVNDTRHSMLSTSERSVVRFYNACLERVASGSGVSTRFDLDATQADGDSDALRPYTDALRRISDWPVLNSYWLASTANTSFNWPHVSAALRRYGVQSLWQLQVQSNWQAAEQQILYISAPAFDLLKPTRQAATYDADSVYLYKRYVKYLMLDLGGRVRRALRIADEVVDFEQQLFALVTSERLLLLHEPQTLAALQQQLPALDLRAYFDTLLRDVIALPVDYARRVLVVADVAYLRRLGALLQRSKPDIIAKYLLVQFLAHFEVRLHDDESYQEQRENCLQQLHSFLPAELVQIFLRLQHADDSVAHMQRTTTQLESIFAELKQQFERMLNATNVFERDAFTKVLGLEKLRAMRLLLPQVSAARTLPVDVVIGENYDENLLRLWQWRTREQFQQLQATLTAMASATSGNPSTATDAIVPAHSSYGPLDVNAYYRLKKNAIELPVGILRTPFYHACLDAAKVYGSFVYIIGHELLHGFDYDGLNYDKLGNVASNWGVKAIIKFGSKSSCFLNGRYANAALTVNEHIADSEGLRLALETYRRRGGENGTLSAAQLKLFFLSFAQTWCGAGVSSSASTTSLHGDHQERVNNAVSNFAEFATAYGCGEESDMNPAEKCRIW